MDRALSQQLTSLLGCPPTFLTDAWLRRVLQSVPFNNAAKSADCAFQHFLSSPIGDSCNSTLPDNIENIKNEVLAGPLVVQFDEVINIAENLENRHKDGQNRTLKFSITDGVRRVFGFEWRKIPGISANSQPGLKAILSEVQVKHGLLMLTPQSVRILGGQVDELVAQQAQVRERATKSLVPVEWLDELGDVPDDQPIFVDGQLILPDAPPAKKATAVPVAQHAPSPVHSLPRVNAPPVRPLPPARHSSPPVEYDAELEELLGDVPPDVWDDVDDSRWQDPGENKPPPHQQHRHQPIQPITTRPLLPQATTVPAHARVRPTLTSPRSSSSTSKPTTPKPKCEEVEEYMDISDIPVDAFDDFDDDVTFIKSEPGQPSHVPPIPVMPISHAPIVSDPSPSPSRAPLSPMTAAVGASQSKLPDAMDVVDPAMDLPDQGQRYAGHFDDDDEYDRFSFGLEEYFGNPTPAKQRVDEIPEPPFNFLAEAAQETYNQRTVKRFHAAVVEVLKPFEFSNNTYKFRVRIEDGTALLDVMLSNDVATELLGVSAAKLEEEKNADMAAMNARVGKATSRIFVCDTIMEVEFGGGEEMPIVLSIDWDNRTAAQDAVDLLAAMPL